MILILAALAFPSVLTRNPYHSCSEEEIQSIEQDYAGCAAEANKKYHNSELGDNKAVCVLLDSLIDVCGNQFARCMTPEELVNMKRLQLELLTGMVKRPGQVMDVIQNCKTFGKYHRGSEILKKGEDETAILSCSLEEASEYLADYEMCVKRVKLQLKNDLADTGQENNASSICLALNKMESDCLPRTRGCFHFQLEKESEMMLASINDSQLILPQECIAPVSPTTSYLLPGLLIVFWAAIVIIVFYLISPYSCLALFRGYCLERLPLKQWGKTTPEPERGTRGILRQQSTIEDMCSYATGKTQGETRPSMCEPLLAENDQHREVALEETPVDDAQVGEEANTKRRGLVGAGDTRMETNPKAAEDALTCQEKVSSPPMSPPPKTDVPFKPFESPSSPPQKTFESSQSPPQKTGCNAVV